MLVEAFLAAFTLRRVSLPHLSMMFSLKVAVAIAPFVRLAASQAAAPIANTTNPFGPLAFTAPGAFPTAIYKEYFHNPTATSAQVQPVITDPVLVSLLARICASA